MASAFLLAIVGIPATCLAGASDPGVLALGDWSEPVANEYGFKLRGRLLICEYPHHRGPRSGTDAALYVELQEYSDFVGAVGEVYWDPRALSCDLTDSAGKAVPMSPGSYGGPVPPACWVKLPSNSSIRLRVSPYAGGILNEGGFAIWTAKFQVWTLKPEDANTYFLAGEFTARPVTDHNPADFRWVWTGTLKLPRLELSAALFKRLAVTVNAGEEAAAPDSIEGQLRSQGKSWVRTEGEITVGAYVQDLLKGRLDQPKGRGTIGKVVSVSPGDNGQPSATVDFGRYSVGIFFSELCPVRLTQEGAQPQ
jgi:hypothetical protein